MEEERERREGRGGKFHIFTIFFFCLLKHFLDSSFFLLNFPSKRTATLFLTEVALKSVVHIVLPVS